MRKHYPASAVLLALLAATAVFAQTSASPATENASPKKVVRLTGCITRATDTPDAYVFSNEKLCVQLKGAYKLSSVLGHQATFDGLLLPATTEHAASFTSQKQVSTGDICSDTCMLQPPPERGVHKKQPGLPASTDGLSQQPH